MSSTTQLFYNHNHQLNWWFALALEGHITGGILKDALNVPPIALLLQAAAKAAVFYAS